MDSHDNICDCESIFCDGILQLAECGSCGTLHDWLVECEECGVAICEACGLGANCWCPTPDE